jgi:hypothetical protein
MEASEQRSRVHRFIWAPLLAGVLGTGVLFWWLGMVNGLRDAGVVEDSRGPLMILGMVVALSMGMALGYPTPIRSYPALVGRLAGGVFFGIIMGVGTVATTEAVIRGGDRRAFAITLIGAAFAALVLGRLYGRRLVAAVRADVATQWKAGVVTAVLTLSTAWALSDRLRCQLGDGASCRTAGNDADEAGEDARALDLFERGCAHRDALSCGLAASRVRRDPGRAEELLHEGCLLGDAVCCGRARARRLEERCDAYSASACRELAEAYARGDEVRHDRTASAKAFRKACLLGDAAACQR